MRPGRLLATLFALGLAVALAPDPVRGAPGPDGETRDGAPVGIGTFRSLRSEVLGEDRLLLVSLPEDYEAGARSYPVLYVLYADQVRGYFAEAVHVVDRLSGEGSMPPTIVVGVANVDRYRDLSPVARLNDAFRASLGGAGPAASSPSAASSRRSSSPSSRAATGPSATARWWARRPARSSPCTRWPAGRTSSTRS